MTLQSIRSIAPLTYVPHTIRYLFQKKIAPVQKRVCSWLEFGSQKLWVQKSKSRMYNEFTIFLKHFYNVIFFWNNSKYLQSINVPRNFRSKQTNNNRINQSYQIQLWFKHRKISTKISKSNRSYQPKPRFHTKQNNTEIRK